MITAEKRLTNSALHKIKVEADCDDKHLETDIIVVAVRDDDDEILASQETNVEYFNATMTKMDMFAKFKINFNETIRGNHSLVNSTNVLIKI